VPAPARLAYKLIGHRQFTRETTAIRGRRQRLVSVRTVRGAATAGSFPAPHPAPLTIPAEASGPPASTTSTATEML